MDSPPPPPPLLPPHSPQPRVSEPENPIPHDLWDWSDLLDFNLDINQLNSSLDPVQPSPDPQFPPTDPNLDIPGRKKARTVRPAAGGKAKANARCQVVGCEADISELKGYHKRHRVCLQCANASDVGIDGQRKRYCQQCGKFHILSDFDEGKRSCRRKLERHNNRRRRKASEATVAVEREPQEPVLVDDVACDDENGKDSICLSSQIAERESLLESEEGQISTLCSNPGSQNIQNDSGISFVASGEVQINGEKDSKHAHSSFYCDNKSAYSSTCPTGRISFKLYDWNPAEFPRRLRHQLHEDPVMYIPDLVGAPGKMLYGRGSLLVYLNNVIFRVMRDGTSVMQVKVEEQAPKLCYVHPTCFEAGKPMEFMACGINLLQPKFRMSILHSGYAYILPELFNVFLDWDLDGRFLVSFAGKYLAYDYCVPPLCGDTEGVTASFNHQLLKIYIPHTEPDLFGPAFIEVENESGLSNFVPILIGNKEICSEIKIMEDRFEASLCLKGSKFMTTSSSSDPCEASVLRQTAFSQFILDTAWLLRKPALEDIEHILTWSHIGRFNRLLTFLIHNKSTIILGRVLHYMDCMKLNKLTNGSGDTDMKLLQSNLDHAREILCQRFQEKGDPVNLDQKGNCLYRSSQIDMPSVSFFDQWHLKLQGTETTETGNLDAEAGSSSQDLVGNLPLLNREVVMNMNLMKKRPGKSCLASRPLVLAIAATTAGCFGICAVLVHPQKAGEIATTIRRLLCFIAESWLSSATLVEVVLVALSDAPRVRALC
ncbi:hypothetical protein TEA_011470 [Camellia sinensis var. sinensis]|uniref:SBP-type domain-containing protein n=1 Tax=Camellia sinensis var. sinensis TaxID=542762 RepID=A0A4S4DJD5_CAMSN|nr:hypothetical protein TEA_011470 [Camellia sinensis var. sinensis]